MSHATPKRRVLAKYPHAYADRHKRVRNWHIFERISERGPALTAGKMLWSAQAAWAEAARKL
jgi:hypothetical protein